MPGQRIVVHIDVVYPQPVSPFNFGFVQCRTKISAPMSGMARLWATGPLGSDLNEIQQLD